MQKFEEQLCKNYVITVIATDQSENGPEANQGKLQS